MAPFAYYDGAPLSVAELSAAALDGDLWRVTHSAYAAMLQPRNNLVRAQAVAEFMPKTHAAVRATAAWIHGLIENEPVLHHIQQVRGTKLNRVWRAGVVCHTWGLPPDDVSDLGGVWVTRIERTYYDIARATFADPGDTAAAFVLDRFRHHSEQHPQILDWLRTRHRMPFTTRAAEALQDDVTR